jgi:3-phosphoshikimate 1-carboxyvinyltransferase
MSDRVAIVPLDGPARGAVRVPGSKSVTNRALALAALADGPTTLTGALIADDSLLFAGALARLGFAVDVDAAAATVRVEGQGGRVPAARAELAVGNAGTAARFLTALVALGHGAYVIDGVARMRERPIADLVTALRQLGAAVECPTGCPPVRVRGAGLAGGTADVAGDRSSQFLSALLMVAPCAAREVTLHVSGELSSRPYVDMTVAVMADFGVAVERERERVFRVRPGRYRHREQYPVEADASAASYFFGAAAITGGAVRVEHVSRQSRQGDAGFLDVLSAMGCRVEERDGGVEVTGTTSLRGVDVDLSDLPDTAQTLAAIAPFAATPTVVRGIQSARTKECDRIAATCAELSRLGVQVLERPDGFVVHPCPAIRGTTVCSWDDHRMAMALALIGLRVPGIVIDRATCVSKTFPRFFDVLRELSNASRQG